LRSSNSAFKDIDLFDIEVVHDESAFFSLVKATPRYGKKDTTREQPEQEEE